MSSTGTKKKGVGGLYFVGGDPLILGVFLCNLGCYNGNGFTELCALAADVGLPVNQEVGKKLHQVVASWSREGGCRRFCHCKGGPLQQPARRLDGLQSVLNAAARLICNRRKYDHVTPLLRDVLHWLPVPFRAVRRPRRAAADNL